MRIVFFGTPEFAVPSLRALLRERYQVAGVVTQPDKPQGRSRTTLVSPPVKTEAMAAGIPILQPTRPHGDVFLAGLRRLEPDLGVVVAYGHLLQPAVLSLPSLGMINGHASLLPRWRGAAPINRAIMAGDSETGVMVMKMEEGLDSGPIAMAERVPIPFDATAGDLHDQLARLGADLVVRALAALERGSLTLTSQPEVGVTYAHKIANDETRIAWERPWQEVHNHIRGLSPVPGAWSEIGSERVKVLRTTRSDRNGVPGTVLDDELTVACGEGAVRIVELQRAGRQPMKAHEFLRGMPVAAGTRFG
jgi:methionyl-tRNA formyltransferase